jgi:hypothetical protein
MFWKLVISALVLPVSIGFSTTAVQASTNSKVSFLDETSSHTSQNLGTVEESPQLIATYHNNCSYGYRSNHSGHGGGHHNNRHGGHGGGYRNNSYGGHGGGYRNNSYGGHGGGYRNNSYGGHGGGHHNNNHGGHGGGHNNHNQGYYNH